MERAPTSPAELGLGRASPAAASRWVEGLGLWRRSGAAPAIRRPTAAASAPRWIFRRRRPQPLEPHRAAATAAATELLNWQSKSKIIQL